MTSLLTLLTNPIGSAAMSRMPQAISSLATWGVVSGLVFMLRSMGIAFNEVVVALLDQPYSSPSLRRFSTLLSAIGSLALLLIAATPLSTIWFEQISALPPDLAELAGNSLWIALPLPLLSVLQSWYRRHSARAAHMASLTGGYLSDHQHLSCVYEADHRTVYGDAGLYRQYAHSDCLAVVPQPHSHKRYLSTRHPTNPGNSVTIIGVNFRRLL
jgi:hypothetical protein